MGFIIIIIVYRILQTLLRGGTKILWKKKTHTGGANEFSGFQLGAFSTRIKHTLERSDYVCECVCGVERRRRRWGAPSGGFVGAGWWVFSLEEETWEIFVVEVGKRLRWFGMVFGVDNGIK